MTDTKNKYCLQCFSCKGEKIELHPNDHGDHCETCICRYNLQICDTCDKYKSSEVANISTCLKCQWEWKQYCQKCEILKPKTLFLGNSEYCGDCQITMLKNCEKCGEETKYYKLDQGKYCSKCQKNMLLECKSCNNKFKYSKFYYCRTRIWCKNCIVKKICIPRDQLLVKYEPN